MNLRCKVCGEKAAGFHFGAFTCEGCKSFFGRCCNNMSIIGECRNNSECVIDKKNRTSCKACRLQKCLSVGMSKNGSRYGRRSNWFKQFFQDTQQQCANSTKIHSKRVTTSSISSEPRTKNSQDEQRDSKKSSTDLCTQSSFSSHLYTSSYLPRVNINRLISYSQNTKFFFPHRSLPLSMLRTEIGVKESWHRLLDRKHDHHTIDDPLDLSKKSQTKECSSSTGNGNGKKILPLDLSIK